MRPPTSRALRRLVRSTLSTGVCLLVAAAVLTGLTPTSHAQAAEVEPYAYLPGHPAYFGNGGTASGGYLGKCTGGYAIAGTDGTFVLGAGGCATVIDDVLGEDRVFARIAARNDTTVLLDVYPPDDAFQFVIDPLTGRSPGAGWVRGVMPTADQTLGTLVGKMGAGSGWTEGRIIGWVPWANTRAICTDASAAPGDAGGPVWRSDERGVHAVGMVVLYNTVTSGACYVPMEEILDTWGAWLPVPGGKAYSSGSGALDSQIPQVEDPTNFTPPVELVPRRDG